MNWSVILWLLIITLVENANSEVNIFTKYQFNLYLFFNQ